MMRRVVRAAVLLLAVGPRPVSAHPIHTTVTVVTIDRAARTIGVSIRAFADDFSDVVARAAGKAPPRDSSAASPDVDAYVRARLRLDGVSLQPCGVTRTTDAYVLCYRASLSQGHDRLRLTNRLLVERHADQVNVVQVNNGSVRRTHLFTAASASIEVLSH